METPAPAPAAVPADSAAGTAAAAQSRLNNLVAVSVALMAVFMSVTKVKDDNICQAMLQAKADAVDTWNQYQATRIKQHLIETATNQAEALQLGAVPAAAARLAEQRVAYAAQIKKYEAAEPLLAAKAKAFEQSYDALNFREDQLDMSDAALSIALGMMAVTALTNKPWLLHFAWCFAAFGVVMGIAGLCGLHLHPDWLTNLLS